MNFNYSANDSNTMTTPDSSNEENHKPILFLFIIPFFVIYFSAWIGKLLYKYFFNLEPVHLVSINCVCDYLFTNLMAFLIQINYYMGIQGYYCPLVEFISGWSSVMIFQGFSLMELDRFLAGSLLEHALL